MHSITPEPNGWTLEIICNDNDDDNSSEELKSCSFLNEQKSNKKYSAELRYEERKHNSLIYVQAIVLNGNGNHETDVMYFRSKQFSGEDCKTKAARYAVVLKNTIDEKYFSTSSSKPY